MGVPYRHETWTSTTNQIKRIETSEMRPLRLLPGNALTDQKRSSAIREKLGISSMRDTIEEYRTKRHGHLLKMEDDRTPKAIPNYEPRDRSNVGRIRRRSSDQVRLA